MKSTVKAGLSAILLAATYLACILPFRHGARALEGARGDPEQLRLTDFFTFNAGYDPAGAFLLFSILVAVALALAFIWEYAPKTRVGRALGMAGALIALMGFGLVAAQTSLIEMLVPHFPGDSGWSHAVAPAPFLLIAAIFAAGIASGLRIAYVSPVWNVKPTVRYGALLGLVFGVLASGTSLLAAYYGNMALDWAMLPLFMPALFMFYLLHAISDTLTTGWTFLIITLLVDAGLGIVVALTLRLMMSAVKTRS